MDEDQRRFMELAVGRKYTIGYHQKVGKGTVTVLGCAPGDQAVWLMHELLNVKVPVRPLTPGVHATRRGRQIVVDQFLQALGRHLVQRRLALVLLHQGAGGRMSEDA